MPVVACPKCAVKLKVPDGTRAAVKCPKCQTAFTPPAPAPAAFEVVGDEPESAPARPKAASQPLPKPKPASKTDFKPVDDDPPARSAVRKRQRAETDEDDEEDERPRKKARRDDDDAGHGDRFTAHADRTVQHPVGLRARGRKHHRFGADQRTGRSGKLLRRRVIKRGLCIGATGRK